MPSALRQRNALLSFAFPYWSASHSFGSIFSQVLLQTAMSNGVSTKLTMSCSFARCASFESRAESCFAPPHSATQDVPLQPNPNEVRPLYQHFCNSLRLQVDLVIIRLKLCNGSTAMVFAPSFPAARLARSKCHRGAICFASFACFACQPCVQTLTCLHLFSASRV